MQPVLYLRRPRDFGEKISDSFLFLKQNGKNLFSIYAVFVVPFIIAAIVIALFFAGRLYGMVQNNGESLQFSDFMTWDLAIILLCFLIAITSYNTAIFSYMRLYDEQRGVKPTVAQVGQLFFRKWFRVLCYNILMAVLIGVIVILPYLLIFFIPLVNLFGQLFIGILFSTIMLHLNIIYVKEDAGLSTAIGRLFSLFRENWWKTIGFNCIMFLIYYVFTFAMVFIVTILSTLLYVFFLMPHGTPHTGVEKTLINLVVLATGGFFILQQALYIMLFCGTGVNYFSLSEEKDGTAIYEQIESIGTNTDKYGGIQEQY
jgi:hypothetical protein